MATENKKTRAAAKKPAQNPVSPSQGESASAAGPASLAAEAQLSNTEGGGAETSAPDIGAGTVDATGSAADGSASTAEPTHQAPSGEQPPAEDGNSLSSIASNDAGSAEPVSAGESPATSDDPQSTLTDPAADADKSAAGEARQALRDALMAALEPDRDRLTPDAVPFIVKGQVKVHGRLREPGAEPVYVWLEPKTAAPLVAAGNLEEFDPALLAEGGD